MTQIYTTLQVVCCFIVLTQGKLCQYLMAHASSIWFPELLKCLRISIMNFVIKKSILSPLICKKNIFILFPEKIAKQNHIKSIKANIMILIVIACFNDLWCKNLVWHTTAYLLFSYFLNNIKLSIRHLKWSCRFSHLDVWFKFGTCIKKLDVLQLLSQVVHKCDLGLINTKFR